MVQATGSGGWERTWPQGPRLDPHGQAAASACVAAAAAAAPLVGRVGELSAPDGRGESALAPGRVDDVSSQKRLQLAAGGPHLRLRSQRGYGRSLHEGDMGGGSEAAAGAAHAAPRPGSQGPGLTQPSRLLGGPGCTGRPGWGGGQALQGPGERAEVGGRC